MASKVKPYRVAYSEGPRPHQSLLSRMVKALTRKDDRKEARLRGLVEVKREVEAYMQTSAYQTFQDSLQEQKQKCIQDMEKVDSPKDAAGCANRLKVLEAVMQWHQQALEAGERAEKDLEEMKK